MSVVVLLDNFEWNLSDECCRRRRSWISSRERARISIRLPHCGSEVGSGAGFGESFLPRGCDVEESKKVSMTFLAATDDICLMSFVAASGGADALFW